MRIILKPPVVRAKSSTGWSMVVVYTGEDRCQEVERQKCVYICVCAGVFPWRAYWSLSKADPDM